MVIRNKPKLTNLQAAFPLISPLLHCWWDKMAAAGLLLFVSKSALWKSFSESIVASSKKHLWSVDHRIPIICVFPRCRDHPWAPSANVGHAGFPVQRDDMRKRRTGRSTRKAPTIHSRAWTCGPGGELTSGRSLEHACGHKKILAGFVHGRC